MVRSVPNLKNAMMVTVITTMAVSQVAKLQAVGMDLLVVIWMRAKSGLRAVTMAIRKTQVMGATLDVCGMTNVAMGLDKNFLKPVMMALPMLVVTAMKTAQIRGVVSFAGMESSVHSLRPATMGMTELRSANMAVSLIA